MNAPFSSVDTLHLSEVAGPKRWLWDGYLAGGEITLLVSAWKSGKTTLLAHLLGRRNNGGLLAGQAVAAGPSAIVSEEGPGLWQERHLKLGFEPHNRFFCRPFVIAPSKEQWCELIAQLATLRQSDGIDLVVIDPLAHFLPGQDENYAPHLLQALLPLRQLTDAGQAVLLIHHPRKAGSPVGMTARGSGLLPAFVDILVEMHLVSEERSVDRRRRLLGFSRDPATPRSKLIEWNADGSDYTVLQEPPPEDVFTQNWHVVRMILEDAARELTRQEMLEQWPQTFPPPKPGTLWTWLKTAVERGLVRTVGTGHRLDPYRYFLAEKLEGWKDDPLYQFTEMMRANDQRVARLVRGEKE